MRQNLFNKRMEMKKLLFFFLITFLSLAAYAQPNIVRGKVFEAGTKNPIPGANVIVKGTTRGVSTDLDGNFTLDKVSPGDVLEISYIGMETQNVKVVAGRHYLEIALKDDTQQLKEVVVIGYGAAQKRDLTGSIASLKTDAFADRPSANPLASIQGKVAGVQIVNTGRAGQDPEIRIRGTNSINGYTPLYVVDGLFTDNINYLNPQDIESMEILKDPSSLAIFGVRGANGVIIITTKKAKKGQTIVNLNSSVGLKSVEDRVAMTDAEGFKTLYNEDLANKGAAPFDYTHYQANTDWQKQIFQRAWVYNHNVSIATSGEKGRFYMGAGYTDEEGSIKHEKLTKYTLNLSSDYNVTDYLRFGFQANGSRTLPIDAKGVGTALKAAPIVAPYDTQSGLLNIMPNFQRAQVWNPLIDVETRANHNKGLNHRLAGNVYGELDFLKYFTFKATLSMDYRIGENREFSPIIWVYNPDTQKRERLTEREEIKQSKSTTVDTQQDYILTFKRQMGDHNITLTGGLTTNYTERSELSAGRNQHVNDIVFGIPENPDKWWISSISGTNLSNGSSQHHRFTMSYLLRGLYSYGNRYLFNASFRRDGASVFHRLGNTWDNFYSFGAGWVVSEEAFMKNQKVVDYLKLKGSWGVLGNQNTGGRNYPTYPILQSSGSAVFGDRIITGYAPAYLVQNLGWEKTYAWEAGAEFRFLGNRLSVEPVYYHKKTKDLIVLLSGIAGAKNSLENLGEIENKGWEFSASWQDQRKESGFSYGVSANLTTIDNKVLSLGRGDNDALYEHNSVARTLAGYPIGHFYGYKVKGVYQTYEDIDTSPANNIATVKPGDLKFEDINGDGVIDSKDRTMIGNPTPDFTYGFSVNLGYKGFDLTAEFMGAYGNEIYRGWGESNYAALNYQAHRLNRWHGKGTSNWEPILDSSRAINQQNSSYYIEDGSFFRFRNVQLGYSLPQEVVQRFKVQKLRFYANVQNLKTWHKNTGYVPEIGGSALAFGIDNGTYPMPMIITYGVNLTF